MEQHPADIQADRIVARVDAVVEGVFDGCLAMVGAVAATEGPDGQAAIARALDAIRKVRDGHRAVMKMRAKRSG